MMGSHLETAQAAVADDTTAVSEMVGGRSQFGEGDDPLNRVPMFDTGEPQYSWGDGGGVPQPTNRIFAAVLAAPDDSAAVPMMVCLASPCPCASLCPCVTCCVAYCLLRCLSPSFHAARCQPRGKPLPCGRTASAPSLQAAALCCSTASPNRTRRRAKHRQARTRTPARKQRQTSQRHPSRHSRCRSNRGRSPRSCQMPRLPSCQRGTQRRRTCSRRARRRSACRWLPACGSRPAATRRVSLQSSSRRGGLSSQRGSRRAAPRRASRAAARRRWRPPSRRRRR